MKVVTNSGPVPRFKSVDSAEPFRFRDSFKRGSGLWIRIGDPGLEDIAANLSTGDIIYPHPEEAVYKVKAEIVEK